LKFKKSTALGFWVIALGIATITASQVWYQLRMSPNGDTVTISEFDGFTTYSFISAILLASLASVFTISFVASLARKIISLISLVLTLGGFALLVTKVSGSDVSGLSKQIEQATGIAANHGLTGVQVSSSALAWLGVASFGLLVIATILVLLSERHWPARVAKIERNAAKGKTPGDSISLWDSQR
jgi:uncharacterized membrane protein